MFKQVLFSAVRVATAAAKLNGKYLLQNGVNGNFIKTISSRNFTLLTNNNVSMIAPNLLEHVQKPQITNITKRTVIKFSIRKGKRKSVGAVLRRFYRLSWGIWIRRKAGCKKKLWKKTSARKRRLRQHVMCNSTQSNMLDKMVGPYWRKRRYYVDDPYEPYHSREEYDFTRTKPRPYIPLEER